MLNRGRIPRQVDRLAIAKIHKNRHDRIVVLRRRGDRKRHGLANRGVAGRRRDRHGRLRSGRNGNGLGCAGAVTERVKTRDHHEIRPLRTVRMRNHRRRAVERFSASITPIHVNANDGTRAGGARRIGEGERDRLPDLRRGWRRRTDRDRRG